MILIRYENYSGYILEQKIARNDKKRKTYCDAAKKQKQNEITKKMLRKKSAYSL